MGCAVDVMLSIENLSVNSRTFLSVARKRIVPECEWVSKMALPRLTNEIIDAAILGFEEQKRRLDAQISELRAMRNGVSHTAPPAARPRSKMSAAGRRAIAEAQRNRWAALKGGAAPEKAPKRAKRKLSAAGSAGIVAALKKRWAAKKAAKKG
jgi:hypothetical protein